MKKNSKSFTTKLSLNVVLITSILFILVIGIVAYSSHKLLAEEATVSAQHLLESTIKEVEKTLKEVAVAAESGAWVVEEHKYDTSYVYHITSKIVSEYDCIVGSAVAYAPDFFPGRHLCAPYSYKDESTGKLISKQIGTDKYNYLDMEWFSKSFERKSASWSEPYYDEGGAGILMSSYSTPLLDDEGNVYAILTADISLQWIADIVSVIKPYPSSHVNIASKDGHYLSIGADSLLKDETLLSTAQKADNEELLDIAKAMMDGKTGISTYSNRGQVSFAVYGPLFNGWSAAIICQYRDVLMRLSRMHLVIILVLLCGLLALFGLCYLTIRKLTKPLQEFSTSALSIANGKFDTVLPQIHSDDEIGQLRDSFDNMQRSLTTYIQNLKETTSANERFESELNIASKIQMAMLPKDFPSNDVVELYASLIPAREVGGDLYDFFLKGDRLYFAIGDVSGKGIPASMFMAITRSAFHFISGLGLSLDQIVAKINNAICDGNGNNTFVTLFVAGIDLKTGRMEYCNAGHNPLVVIDPEEGPSLLKVVPNIAVGVVNDFEYKLQSVDLRPGTRLVAYTDGVTEAECADKSLFGEERLVEWARSAAADLSAEQAVASLLGEVRAFAGGNEQNDDITIMTIKIK